MSTPVTDITLDIDALVTEDDTPVDIFSGKQQRLLTEPLYSSWAGPKDETEGTRRPFLVSANVGMFYALNQPPLVPDVFLSLDVQLPEDWWRHKKHRSYFFWEIGKPPEVVIEIVSNREGNELGSKLRDYARIGVPYYVVYDPMNELGEQSLRIYEARVGKYVPRLDRYLDGVGLGVTLWEGVYEDMQATWLRWADDQGVVIPTGAEAKTIEAQRAERLAAKLRELGVDPDQLKG